MLMTDTRIIINDSKIKKKAYVFLSGEPQGTYEYYRKIIGDSHIYCGDGGGNLVHTLGLNPLEIWGDMDSIEERVLEEYRNKGVSINAFEKDKDFTDGELILEYVSSKDYDEILVIGAFGGRMDHSLTNTNLLFKYSKVRFITEKEEVFPVDKYAELNYPSGTTVSFIPFTDIVEGLTLKGVKFPLNKFILKRGDSICMSNIIEELATIEFTRGKILCIVQKTEEKA